MKIVTINNNWVKISDLIEKDSVITVKSGSRVNITDNINTNTIKFSTYKIMENFNAKKKTSLWIKSEGFSSILDIFELETEITASPGSGSGFPTGNTNYENIGEIESDISGIKEKLAVLTDEVKIFTLDMDKEQETEEFFNSITKAFEYYRKGCTVLVKNINGFLKHPDKNLASVTGTIEFKPVINDLEYYLEMKLSFSRMVSNIRSMEILIPVDEQWRIKETFDDIYEINKWRFYGSEEMILENINFCKFLNQNGTLAVQSFTQRELGIDLNLKVFKEIDVYYTIGNINNTFGAGKITINHFSDINTNIYDDSTSFSNQMRQTGHFLFKGNITSSSTETFLKVSFVSPSNVTGDPSFCIKKIIGKYY
ncbi:MAG: hypothetical protein LBV03_09290 [Fusobacteriales bacterium]|jgi:uncharacterized protein YihD (DUF1040 family)|nr:hypothetical protein [Fusobacteriales bacterium]